MAVLATIVTVLLTVTIDNMRVQEKQIERMQDQYEAQGKLEKVLANLSQNQVVELQTHNSQSAAIKAAIEAVPVNRVTYHYGEEPFKIWKWENGNKIYLTSAPDFNTEFSFDFKISAKSDNREVEVIYDLQLKGKIACSEPFITTGVTESGESARVYLYIITSPELIHKSVDVIGVLPDTEPDEGGGD